MNVSDSLGGISFGKVKENRTFLGEDAYGKFSGGT